MVFLDSHTARAWRIGWTAALFSALVFPARAELVGHWTFEQHANDLTGHFGPTALFNGAAIENGMLRVSAAQGSWAKAAGYAGPLITEKTLVAWVRMDQLGVFGGSALTLERDSADVNANKFDGLVYGEVSPRKWMAGSEFYTRTESAPQQGWWEDAGPDTTVVMAAVYRLDGTISIYRDAVLYSTYQKGDPISNGAEPTAALFGRRHTWNGLQMPYLSARIGEARIYDEALSQQAIGRLVLGLPEPASLAGLCLGALALLARRRSVR